MLHSELWCPILPGAVHYLSITLLLSEIPSGICAKLRTMAASNNRVHMP